MKLFADEGMDEAQRRQHEAELRRRYPKRYEWYLRSLRRTEGETPEEREHAEQEAHKYRVIVDALNRLDIAIMREHERGSAHPRDIDQIKTYEALRGFLEQGKNKGYLKLPTGYGKTVVFSRLMEALHLKALVVVPKQDLIDQTLEKLDDHAPSLDVGAYYADEKRWGADGTVITYDSFHNLLNEDKASASPIKPEDYDLVILDEAHRGLSDLRQQDVVRFEHAITLGFTATPEFNEEKKVEAILPEMIRELSMKEAADRGILCRFNSLVVETDAKISSGDLSSEERTAAWAAANERRTAKAVDVYMERFGKEKGVAYCVGIEHAQKTAEEFRARGIVAEVIHGGMDKEKERKPLLAAYKAGKVQVLCNADILIEGFDEPSASVCLNLRPTRSRVNAEQRAGRVMRLDPQRPDKEAWVVDILDQYEGAWSQRPLLFPEVVNVVASGGPAGEVPRLPEADLREGGTGSTTKFADTERIIRERGERTRVEESRKVAGVLEEAGFRGARAEDVVKVLRSEGIDWFFTTMDDEGETELRCPDDRVEELEALLARPNEDDIPISDLEQELGFDDMTRSREADRERFFGELRALHPELFSRHIIVAAGGKLRLMPFVSEAARRTALFKSMREVREAITSATSAEIRPEDDQQQRAEAIRGIMELRGETVGDSREELNQNVAKLLAANAALVAVVSPDAARRLSNEETVSLGKDVKFYLEGTEPPMAGGVRIEVRGIDAGDVSPGYDKARHTFTGAFIISGPISREHVRFVDDGSGESAE